MLLLSFQGSGKQFNIAIKPSKLTATVNAVFLHVSQVGKAHGFGPCIPQVRILYVQKGTRYCPL